MAKKIKCFVTSIGEPTTDVCVWSLKRNGFDVELLQDNSSLQNKLKRIFEKADDDFLRVDADITVNKNLTPEFLSSLELDEIWWWQFLCFDWYKLDIAHCMSFIKKPAIEHLRANIDRFERSLRPETDVSRIEELHNPRRLLTYEDRIVGLHGYGIKDIQPVIELKKARNQDYLYDFEMVERLKEL